MQQVPTLPLAPQLQLHLPTTTSPVAAATQPDRRKVFWHAYLDWLATATEAETDQLELALLGHAHHVRPLMDVVNDAFRTRERALELPHTLLVCLYASGWRPLVLNPRNDWIAA